MVEVTGFELFGMTKIILIETHCALIYTLYVTNSSIMHYRYVLKLGKKLGKYFYLYVEIIA